MVQLWHSALSAVSLRASRFYAGWCCLVLVWALPNLHVAGVPLTLPPLPACPPSLPALLSWPVFTDARIVRLRFVASHRSPSPSVSLLRRITIKCPSCQGKTTPLLHVFLRRHMRLFVDVDIPTGSRTFQKRSGKRAPGRPRPPERHTLTLESTHFSPSSHTHISIVRTE
jgi:hypothetical protein